MSYINKYSFLEGSEGYSGELLKENKMNHQKKEFKKCRNLPFKMGMPILIPMKFEFINQQNSN